MSLKYWKISGVECVRTLESNDCQLWTQMSLSSGVELVMVVESNVFGLCARMSFVSGLEFVLALVSNEYKIISLLYRLNEK